MATSPAALARKLLTILVHDREEYLLGLDAYIRGEQSPPYMPENADEEYKLLAARAITNVMPFVSNTPTQAMYVDQFRKGGKAGGDDSPASETTVTPEWEHWQKSRLDARQSAIYRGAFHFGHSFVLTEMDKKRKTVLSKGLSALTTAAIYEDPANDFDPYAALNVISWPTVDGDKQIPGKARMWNETDEFDVSFASTADLKKGVSAKFVRKHGAKECPVTRFACAIDLEGRTWGVVEPMIPIQDRINQTVFDLLIVQSYASFKVRTISGMAPPMKMIPVDSNGNEVTGDLNSPAVRDTIVDWEPLIVNGKPVPDDVNLNAKRFLFAEDADTNFGTLDETPLDGFIKAIEMGFRHMAALSQTPPHHILGEIANLSAEALTAAETALSRKIEEFKSAFGECWERVFRVAAEIGGFDGAEDFAGEVLWRDMEQQQLATSADALGKMAESLGIPKRGLWQRVPGVTSTEISHWEKLALEENPSVAAATALRRATPAVRPTFRAPSDTPPTPTVPVAPPAA